MDTQIVRRSFDCPQLPAMNESFDLEIDGALETAPSGWRLVEEDNRLAKKTYRCRLAHLGCCENVQDAVHRAEQQYGNVLLAPGCARQAFMAKYPRHSGHPVVMGGSVWQDITGDRRVASLGGYRDGQWSPSFAWSSKRFNDSYLWLIMEAGSVDTPSRAIIDLPNAIASEQLSDHSKVVVVYRVSGVLNNAPRPAWFSKEICLRSFLRSVSLARETFAVEVVLLQDHRSEMSQSLAEIVELAISGHEFVPREVTSSGNCGSYLEAVEIALDLTGDKDFILLAEDDYLWLPESISIMVDAFAELPAADYITPYDHPTRYRRAFFGGQNIPHWCPLMYCAGGRHFRSHETTCMTFMVRSSVLREDEAIHQVYSRRDLRCPADRELFKALQYLGEGTVRPPHRRLLLGPVPSLATHAHLPLLAPVVDWGKIAAEV